MENLINNLEIIVWLFIILILAIVMFRMKNLIKQGKLEKQEGNSIHKISLEIEYSEKRLEELDELFNNDKIRKLKIEEKNLLLKQRRILSDYLEILNLRKMEMLSNIYNER